MRLALVALVAWTSLAVPAPKHQPGAVVVVIDLRWTRSSQLDAAKSATLAMADALSPDDQIAVVALGSDSKIVVPLQVASNRAQIAKQLSPLGPGRGSRIIRVGLQTARDLLKPLGLSRNHVILFSDGGAASEDPRGLVDLLDSMHDAQITTTCIGAQGADRSLLALIAHRGNGRLILIDDISALAKLFTADAVSALR